MGQTIQQRQLATLRKCEEASAKVKYGVDDEGEHFIGTEELKSHFRRAGLTSPDEDLPVNEFRNAYEEDCADDSY